MGAVVDLTNLRDMMGGDEELEREIFQEFLSSSETCIRNLEASCASGNESGWHSASHALKGSALNLGAAHLGELCKTAQESASADISVKTALLDQIKIAFEEVRQFLMTV